MYHLYFHIRFFKEGDSATKVVFKRASYQAAFPISVLLTSLPGFLSFAVFTFGNRVVVSLVYLHTPMLLSL